MKTRISAILLISIIAGCSSQGAASTSPAPTRSGTRAPTQAPAVFVRSGTPAPTPVLMGQFTFAPGDGSIWTQDVAGGRAKPLVTPSPDLFADAPNFSADGKHITYIQSSLKAQGTVQSSVYAIDTDGKNNRELVTAPDAKTGFNNPIYSPDGNWVYFSATFPVPPSDRRSEIQRVPASGGKPEKILDDARSPTISPDGKHFAFLRFNNQTFSAGLWISDADGKNAQPLLADDVFAAVAAPRFSPDGEWILFVASGPPSRSLPTGMLIPSQNCEPVLLCVLAQPARADGLPWDLWMVSADGSRFRQLTNVGADSPWPAWSRDGKYIAFFETTGIYVLEMGSRALVKLNANGGHGVFDWWSEP